MVNTYVPKGQPPWNLTVFKGNKNSVLNRTFCSFLLHHPVSKIYYRWLQDTDVPDESFYNTLDRVATNEEGSQISQNLEPTWPESLSPRYTLWIDSWIMSFINTRTWCYGNVVREICQFSVRDIRGLTVSSEDSVFVNKFNASVDALALACWLERISRWQI